MVLSWLTGSPTEFGLVCVGLPVLAAILIAHHDESGYLNEDRRRHDAMGRLCRQALGLPRAIG